MNYTPAAAHERHAYVDRTLEAALVGLQDPEVIRCLGGLANTFTHALSSAVVANVRMGELQMPDKHKDNDDVLPVVAVYPDEAITMSPDFDRQTTSQKANTINQLKKWQPKQGRSAKELYGKLVAGPHNGTATPPFIMTELSQAMTGTAARLLDARMNLVDYFLEEPKLGIAVVKMKPVLIFKVSPTLSHSRAEDTAHELTHAKQIVQKPVTVLTSQKSADMSELRGELEAYHVGSTLTYQRFSKMGIEAFLDGPIDHGVVQMGVEIERQKHGIDPLDPYRPSPLLLRRLNEAGLGIILHNSMNYEALVSAFDSVKASQA